MKKTEIVLFIMGIIIIGVIITLLLTNTEKPEADFYIYKTKENYIEYMPAYQKQESNQLLCSEINKANRFNIFDGFVYNAEISQGNWPLENIVFTNLTYEKYTEEIRKKLLADNNTEINEDLLNHIELSNLCQWAQENIDLEIKEENPFTEIYNCKSTYAKINEKVKENYLDILDACLLENTEELNISEYKKITKQLSKKYKESEEHFLYFAILNNYEFNFEEQEPDFVKYKPEIISCTKKYEKMAAQEKANIIKETIDNLIENGKIYTECEKVNLDVS